MNTYGSSENALDAISCACTRGRSARTLADGGRGGAGEPLAALLPLAGAGEELRLGAMVVAGACSFSQEVENTTRIKAQMRTSAGKLRGEEKVTGLPYSTSVRRLRHCANMPQVACFQCSPSIPARC